MSKIPLTPIHVLGRNGYHRGAYAVLEGGALHIYTGTVREQYPLVSMFGTPDELVRVTEDLAAQARALRTQALAERLREASDL